MNVTERAKTTTVELEGSYRALDRAIEVLRAQQHHLREAIDARRLQERPAFPSEVQLYGIEESVRRFTMRRWTKSQHGDYAGPKEEPTAVVYRPQGNLGWMHIRHGAPFAFEGNGGSIWHFTDEEIQSLLKHVEDQGVKIFDHWKSVGGLSVRFGSVADDEVRESAKHLKTSRELANRPTVEDAYEQPAYLKEY